MELNWTKCVGGVWCPLLSVNLDHEHFNNLSGVYVIWHSGQDPATVYVGSGNITDRLREHRRSSDILQFSEFGLFVTWARVPATRQEGVERFLADTLRPKVGERHPDAHPVTVNLPW